MSAMVHDPQQSVSGTVHSQRNQRLDGFTQRGGIPKCGKDPSSTVKIQMILPMIKVVRKRDIEGKKIK